MSNQSQPNYPTPEEIKGMLILDTPPPVQKVVDAYRALLEENKQLQSGWDKHLASSAKDYLEISRLQEQLQQIREEVEEWKLELDSANSTNFKLIEKLKQVKAERDRWYEDFMQERELSKGQKDHLLEGIKSLSTELSAKDKVLEWYAQDDNYLAWSSDGNLVEVMEDRGKQARSILSQYKGG